MGQKPESIEGDLRKFTRVRELRFVRSLGSGACGQTALLHDDSIDIELVCKKYAPFAEEQRQLLFDNFVREIKLLYSVSHINVVRIYNHYLYPDQFAGFILMEHVKGSTIDAHTQSKPEDLNDLFLQAVAGFRHLSQCGILHRDIRPENLMVTATGTLKIIDLGFGKNVVNVTDFNKSVSLNWWCETPADFDAGKYDFSTEVYFLGKLFEKLIQDSGSDSFAYADALRTMCQHERKDRPADFDLVRIELRADFVPDFSNIEKQTYRLFADAFVTLVPKIRANASYTEDTQKVVNQLQELYRKAMLELQVNDVASLVRVFINGAFYVRQNRFGTELLKHFLQLLRNSSEEKRRIILANLYSKLEAIERYYEDDDIPF